MEEVGLCPGDIVIDGDPVPFPQRGTAPPNYRGGLCPALLYICCGQIAGCFKMPLAREVALNTSNIVLDGDHAPLRPKGHSPQFPAHICCGQMAGCVRILLGMEVGLCPGDIVIDGDPAPPVPRGTAPSSFWPMSVVAKQLDGLRCDLVWR